MDLEAHHALHNGKVSNGDHFHSVQYDTIREVPDALQITRKKSLSNVSVPGPAVGEGVNSSVPNSDLDGGYGWVIVMASFFIAFIVDGIGSSFGLLLPYILSSFGTTAFVTSFAGSLFVAFMIMGSISAELVRRFGFRAVTLTGSVLSCLSFVVSAFSSNIYIFIVTYGLLAGCSCGLVFIPSIVIVNEYFHQKRGIANGIISSGSGVGLLVLGPVISNILLDTYLLNGTVLILAGVLLNMCVFSSLFRPLAQNRRRAVYVSDDCDKDCNIHHPLGSLSSNLSADNVDHFALGEIRETKVKDGHGRKDQRTVPGFDIGEVLRKCHQTYLSTSLDSATDQRDAKSTFYVEYMLSHLKPGVSALTHPSTSSQFSQRPENHKSLGQRGLRENEHWRSDLHIDFTNVQSARKHHQVYSMYEIPAWSQVKGGRYQMHKTFVRSHKHLEHHDQHKPHHSHRSSRHYSLNLSIDHGSSFYLAGSISTLLNLHNSFLQTLQGSDPRAIHSSNNIYKKMPEGTRHSEDCEIDCEKLLKHASSKPDNGDLEREGGNDQPVSVQPVEVHKSCRSVAKSDYSILADGNNSDTSMESEPSPPLGYTLLQLLYMPSFHFFCLGASLIQIGYPLAGTFLAEYAYQFGLTTFHTAVLMGLLGGLNVCGRLLAGALVSLKADPLLINNISLLLGGVACLMSPLYTEFWSLCVFAGMFGFFLGFFPPLQPLIIVKHFGLDSLASAFGFLSTVKGVASILGAPLAGFIYDVTGQYSMSFMFGGVVFILSSFVHCVMACGGRCRKQILYP